MRHRLAAMLSLTLLSIASAPLFAAQPDRCGTKQPGLEEVAQIEQGLARGQKGKTSDIIPVWVHVISRGAGYENGELPDAMINAQLKVLDESFNGRSGGANTGFGFDLGNFNTINGSAFVSGPITSGIRARLALKHQHRAVGRFSTRASPGRQP